MDDELLWKIIDALDQTWFRALAKIQTILMDDSLDDFMCIDEIVNVLESVDFHCGNRHDFG